MIDFTKNKTWVGHTARREDVAEMAALLLDHGTPRLRSFAQHVLAQGDMLAVFREV